MNEKEIKAVNTIQEWIVDCEMEGKLDKTDPFYPAFQRLEEVREKLEEENIG